jgi:hypothetical protein
MVGLRVVGAGRSEVELDEGSDTVVSRTRRGVGGAEEDAHSPAGAAPPYGVLQAELSAHTG